VENFGWNFSANPYSLPECATLSSAALVTAAQKVQRASPSKILQARHRSSPHVILSDGEAGARDLTSAGSRI
jgi:hypothetical protein